MAPQHIVQWGTGPHNLQYITSVVVDYVAKKRVMCIFHLLWWIDNPFINDWVALMQRMLTLTVRVNVLIRQPFTLVEFRSSVFSVAPPSRFQSGADWQFWQRREERNCELLETLRVYSLLWSSFMVSHPAEGKSELVLLRSQEATPPRSRDEIQWCHMMLSYLLSLNSCSLSAWGRNMYLDCMVTLKATEEAVRRAITCLTWGNL